MYCIKTFRLFGRHSDHLHGLDREAVLLNHGQNFTGQVAGHGVRLDNGKCTFNHAHLLDVAVKQPENRSGLPDIGKVSNLQIRPGIPFPDRKSGQRLRIGVTYGNGHSIPACQNSGFVQFAEYSLPFRDVIKKHIAAESAKFLLLRLFIKDGSIQGQAVQNQKVRSLPPQFPAKAGYRDFI